MIKLLWIILACLIFLSATVSGLELKYYGIEDSVKDDFSVIHEITLQFNSSITHLDYNFGFKIFNLTSEANFDFADCKVTEKNEKSSISCDFIGITEQNNILKLVFETKDSIKKLQDKYQFAANYGIPVPIERAFTLIRLPQNGRLSEDIANQSFFPREGNILTDGKHIMVYWEKENLTSGDNLQFSVLYNLPIFGNVINISAWIIAIIIIFIMVIVIIGIILVQRSSRVSTVEIVTSVLNEDEKKIVDILKVHGGKTGQKNLVRESGFSKAKVSRLVSSLKERNVVVVEPVSGRENTVFLKVKQE